MASGAAKVIRGSVVGTGSAIDVRTVGFRPRSVKLENVGGNVSARWQHTMADASAALEITDGTKSLITADGITPLSDGFTIGADANINAATELIHWEAVE